MTHTPPPTEKTLTLGQKWALGAATVPMIGFGGLGAWGTYTNIKAIFPEQATALGVVAAGEGATLVLALVYVGLTLLGQTAPAAVRLGLWILPALASATGAIVAPTTTDAVVYAVTPLAMCVSAEGIGLLARRIVIHRTGVDMEVQRRNAATLQRLAYHRARSAGHPWGWTRKWSALAAWRIARRVGVGDAQLGTGLVVVQRERMTAGADAALADMFTPAVTPAPAHALASAVTPALAGSVTPALPAGAGRDGTVTGPVTDAPAHHTAVTDGTQAVTGAVTQVSAETAEQASRPSTETVTPAVTAVTPPVTETVTDAEASRTHGSVVTVEEIAAVAGVPTPVPGEHLTDGQLDVVLRHLRHDTDPPRSYRRAIASFRDAGYVGGEARVRRAWGELMSREETTAPATGPAENGQPKDEGDSEDEESEGPRP